MKLFPEKTKKASGASVKNEFALVRKIAVCAMALSMLITSPGAAFLSYATETAPEGKAAVTQNAEDNQQPSDQKDQADNAADANASSDEVSSDDSATLDTDAAAKDEEDSDKKSESDSEPAKNDAPADKAAEPKTDAASEKTAEEADGKGEADEKAAAETEDGVIEVSSEVGSYTVDFYYTPENGEATEYHLKGGSSIMLSELFRKLGIDRDTADIKENVFTDNELVRFEKVGDDYKVISLKPFNTEETLTITFEDGEVIVLAVEDAVTQSGSIPSSNGKAYYEFDSATGELRIRALNAATETAYVSGNLQDLSSWPWNNIRDQVKKVTFTKGTSGYGVGFAGVANRMFENMTNLEEIDFSGMAEIRANGMARLLAGCSKLENVDMSMVTTNGNLSNMQNMFRDCTSLKTVKLNNADFKTRTDSTKSGANLSGMFNGCSSLEEVDMSNITLTGNSTANRELSNPFTGSSVKSIKMDNIKFVNVKSLNNFVSSLNNLEEVSMTGNVDADSVETMINMFANDTALKTLNVSGFGQLSSIANMDHFVDGCTSLETLNIDNLDNSAIGPYNTRHSITEDDALITGCQEYGRMLDIHTCTALKTLSAKSSKVWMCYNNRGLPGNEYYNAAEKSEIYYFTTKQMDFDPDSGSDVTIQSDRDYIDLVTDRDGAANKHATNPAKDPLPDAGKNINIVGGDKNPHGPGYLAPGVYTIKNDDRSDAGSVPMEDTYYRIAYVGMKPYKVELPEGGINDLVIINADANKRTTICTNLKSDWPKSGNYEIDCGEGIKITYENVAIDCNGKLHDVVVTIKKITFKDLDRIPDTSKTLGGYTYEERIHDGNYLGYKVLGPNQAYYRPVLQATEDSGIVLFNYIYDGNGAQPTGAEVGNRMLTGGSGTDIDFTIEIDKANDDTSYVFYAKDLDVAASQSWVYPNKDACYDNLPVGNVTYGQGGEGFVLGEGVEKDTVQFAEHTGLYQSEDKTKVMTTGSDPNTPWSQFTVTANAKGSDFTWTSGISCTSYILENTKEQDLGEITIQPQVLKKLINGTLGAGDFEFKIEKVNMQPNGMPEPVNAQGDPVTFPQTKYNDASGNVTFDEMIFKSSSNNALIDGWSANTPYFPGTSPNGNSSGNGTHNSVTYTYKVTEVQPTAPKSDIIYDNSDHKLEIKISTPEDDAEMAKGIKAEIYVDDALSKTVWSKGVSNPVALTGLEFKNEQIPPGEIKDDETYGLKGSKQTGMPKYDVIQKNPVAPTKLVKPDADGAVISGDGKTVTIPGEGEYVLNDDGSITFTPESDFIGDPTPVKVEGADTLGNSITATYTPHVVDPSDEGTATRTVHFTYENKNGKQVTAEARQTVTLTRSATEVNPKTGEVTKWGPWEPATFPAVDNPDKEAGEGWTTSDSVKALTVNEPGAVADEYVIYVKKNYTVTYEDGDHGKSDGGSVKKNYGATPQNNKVTPDDGYKFTGKYTYVITDEDGKVIDSGTTDNPQSITVTGNIVFTPEYEKLPEPEPEPEKQYTVTYVDGEHGKSNGGSESKKYGDNPQDNTVVAEEGYRFTGKYKYVITDENGIIIDEGTTDDPESVKVIGNIVFTPIYEKVEADCPDCNNKDDNKEPEKADKNKGVATGDNNHLIGWIALLLATLIASAIVVIRRRIKE